MNRSRCIPRQWVDPSGTYWLEHRLRTNWNPLRTSELVGWTESYKDACKWPFLLLKTFTSKINISSIEMRPHLFLMALAGLVLVSAQSDSSSGSRTHTGTRSASDSGSAAAVGTSTGGGGRGNGTVTATATGGAPAAATTSSGGGRGAGSASAAGSATESTKAASGKKSLH